MIRFEDAVEGEEWDVEAQVGLQGAWRGGDEVSLRKEDGQDGREERGQKGGEDEE